MAYGAKNCKTLPITLMLGKNLRNMCEKGFFEGSMSKKEKYNFRWVEFIAMEALNQSFWIQCTSMNRWH